MKDNMRMQHKGNILEFRIHQQHPTLQQVHIPQLVHVELHLDLKLIIYRMNECHVQK